MGATLDMPCLTKAAVSKPTMDIEQSTNVAISYHITLNSSTYSFVSLWRLFFTEIITFLSIELT